MAGPQLIPDAGEGGDPGPGGGLPGSPVPSLERISAAIMPESRCLSGAELASEAGVDLELARRLRRAMGLPDVPAGEDGYLDADVDALRRVRRLIETGGLDNSDLLHMARTLGLAAARMADAVVGFWSDRLAASGEDMLDRGRVDELEKVVGYLFRRHLLYSATRQASWAGTGEEGAVVAVGFADLVGFTSLSEQLSDRETAELIERFEVLATDQIVGGGGRVIKMIGDEVMFSSDAGSVGGIALSLAETFDSPELPSVRVGVASGSVVSQGGDLYGPVVNLAARATIAARPGTVLISPSLAEMLRDDPRFAVQAIRPHRLKGIGFVRLAVLRRQGGRA